MADAGAVAAPTAQAVATPQAQSGETKAEAVARIKADLGDGEQEYEPGYVTGLARKGREAARLVSKADQRAQEVAKKEKDLTDRLAVFKGKDLKAIRKALRDMGVDDLALANDVGTEKLREMDMTPEQRRIHELEQERDGRLKQDEDAKGKEQEAKRTADVERHKESLSELFMESMDVAGIPRSSASAAFPKLSRAYMAADAAGVKLTPAIAADYLRAGIEAEHKALYSKADEKTGQPVLDVKGLGDALNRTFGPDAMNALNRYAVQQYRAGRGNAVVAVAPTEQQPSDTAPTVDSTRINFWKELKKKGL